MARPAADDDETSWFTPTRLLFLFCVVNLLVFMDRGLIGSNGVNGKYTGDPTTDHGIQGDFKLTDFEDGVLASAFMVGLLISSPIFADASKRYNAIRLMGIGLLIWTLATLGCALSIGFWSILLFRMFVGVGEASFVALAAPFIDDSAPPGRKTLWLATFYFCTPTGYALGYVLGGVVHATLGYHGDWRVAFLLESLVMVPFVLFLLLVKKPIDLHGKGNQTSLSLREFFEGVWLILKHPVYSISVIGYAIYTGVLGVFAYWGPKAGCVILNLESSSADLLFGGVTVLTGIVGTLSGGMLLDQIGATLPRTLGMCAFSVFTGGAILMATFAYAKNIVLFFALFAVGELLMFCIQAPVNAVSLWCVPTSSRPLAMSLVIIIIHILGDVPSPSIVGAVQGHINNWRVTMGACSSALLLSGIIFGIAMRVSYNQPDYRVVGVTKAQQVEYVDDEAETTNLLQRDEETT